MSKSLLKPGDVVDKYEIIDLVGSGAIGEVYRARHTFMGTEFALKCLSLQFADRADFARRMKNEAVVLSRLRHPNVVAVHNAGVDELTRSDGRSGQILWIAMELLSGRTLRALLLEQRALSLRRTAAMVRQIAEGVQVAHDLGVVHRDLKPENVFLVDEPPGLIKILDLGTAKYFTGAELKTTGQRIGTLAYMSPEQLEGVADPRTDIYATATMAYECVAGRHPFAKDRIYGLPPTHELAALQISKAPDALPLIVPGFPDLVWRVLSRALRKRAEERQPSIREFAAEFVSAVAEFEHTGGNVEAPLARALSSDLAAAIGGSPLPPATDGMRTEPLATDYAPAPPAVSFHTTPIVFSHEPRSIPAAFQPTTPAPAEQRPTSPRQYGGAASSQRTPVSPLRAVITADTADNQTPSTMETSSQVDVTPAVRVAARRALAIGAALGVLLGGIGLTLSALVSRKPSVSELGSTTAMSVTPPSTPAAAPPSVAPAKSALASAQGSPTRSTSSDAADSGAETRTASNPPSSTAKPSTSATRRTPRPPRNDANDSPLLFRTMEDRPSESTSTTAGSSSPSKKKSKASDLGPDGLPRGPIF